MKTIEEVNKWVSSARKGEKSIYYKGFLLKMPLKVLK